MPPDALSGAVWSVATILVYLINRALYIRNRAWWLSPIFASPAVVLAFLLISRTSYATYSRGTHWLVELLGPVTVAFAVPIYRHRILIRKNALFLTAGILAGCAVAFVSSWGLASCIGLSELTKLSLLPRSMSTPFAMAVSKQIGGAPDLTAVFTAITGIAGIALGESLLKWIPLRSAFARGALFGMGAHGAGVAKAQQLGSQEASSAGLVMVLVGISCVVASPWLAHLLMVLHLR